MSQYPAAARGLEPAFDSIARAAVAALVKRRARALARDSATLDSILPGLSSAQPETMITVARHVLGIEREVPQRWFGFGGEVRALNAKAVLLLGRARRRWATAARVSASASGSPR